MLSTMPSFKHTNPGQNFQSTKLLGSGVMRFTNSIRLTRNESNDNRWWTNKDIQTSLA